MEMSRADMQIKVRTPIGLLLVLSVLGKWLLDTFEEGRVILENLPPVLRFFTKPIPNLVLLLVGIGLILWELHSIRKASSEPAKRHLRHYMLGSLFSFVGLLIILAVVAGAFVLHARISRGPTSVAKQPALPTSTSQQKTDQSPTSADDSADRPIVLALIEDYKKSHKGQLPTYEWVNGQLKKDGRSFHVEPPESLAPSAIFQLNRSDGNKFRDIHSEFESPLAQLNQSDHNEFSNMTAGQAVVKTATKKKVPVAPPVGNDSGSVGGNINAAPCSAVQVGGHNQATVNCVPQNPNDTTVVYTFDGRKIERLPDGSTNNYRGSDQDEADAFEQMVALEKSGDWRALSVLSEREMKKVPTWPTPYFFCGRCAKSHAARRSSMPSLGPRLDCFRQQPRMEKSKR